MRTRLRRFKFWVGAQLMLFGAKLLGFLEVSLLEGTESRFRAVIFANTPATYTVTLQAPESPDGK